MSDILTENDVIGAVINSLENHPSRWTKPNSPSDGDLVHARTNSCIYLSLSKSGVRIDLGKECLNVLHEYDTEAYNILQRLINERCKEIADENRQGLYKATIEVLNDSSN